jgi:hypothetical protein
MQGVSKRALQLYSKCYCVASVKRLRLKAYKLSIVQGSLKFYVLLNKIYKDEVTPVISLTRLGFSSLECTIYAVKLNAS